MTLFDYLDDFVAAFRAGVELPAGSVALPDPGLATIAAALDAAMIGTGAEAWLLGPDVASAGGLDLGLGAELGVTAGAGLGGPTGPWLSGNEWSGETGLTAGTIDTSGSGAHVFSVGGKVLDLPT